MLGQVTTTSASTVFDNRETIHTSIGAESPLGQTRLPALSLNPRLPTLNMTHSDTFSGEGWGCRVIGHVIPTTHMVSPIFVTHLGTDFDAPSVHAMRPHSTPEHHQFNSILNSRLTVTNATPQSLDSAPGSVPEVSPDQSRKKYTSTSPHGRGGDHGGHAEASFAPREPDNTTRYESPMSLGDVGREVTHVDTLT